MKDCIYSTCLVFICVLIFSCDKKEADLKYKNAGIVISLNNSVLLPTNEHPATNSASFFLDIDNDQISDIEFEAVRHSLGRESYQLLKIKLFNGFSLKTQKALKYSFLNITTIDSISTTSLPVDVPGFFALNDMITKDLQGVNDSILLAYNLNDSYAQFKWRNYIPYWLDKGDGYLCIYNDLDNILGWIKVNVANYDHLILKSFYYSIGKDSLKIEE